MNKNIFSIICILFLTSCGDREILLEEGERLGGALKTFEEIEGQRDNLDDILEKNAKEDERQLLRAKIEKEAGCNKEEWADGSEGDKVLKTIITLSNPEKKVPEKIALITGDCLALRNLSLFHENLKSSTDPIIISARHFKLDEAEVFETKCRDLVIFAEKVEIKGKINTQPEKPFKFSHGKDAGNIYISSLILDISPTAAFNLNGGEAFSLPSPETPKEFFKNPKERNNLIRELSSQRESVEIYLDEKGKIYATNSRVFDEKSLLSFQKKIAPFNQAIQKKAQRFLKQHKDLDDLDWSFSVTVDYFPDKPLELRSWNQKSYSSDLKNGASGKLAFRSMKFQNENQFNISFKNSETISLKGHNHFPFELHTGSFSINSLNKSSESSVPLTLKERITVSKLWVSGNKISWRPARGEGIDHEIKTPTHFGYEYESPQIFEINFNEPREVKPSAFVKVEKISVEESENSQTTQLHFDHQIYEKILSMLEKTELQMTAFENDLVKDLRGYFAYSSL